MKKVVAKQDNICRKVTILKQKYVNFVLEITIQQKLSEWLMEIQTVLWSFEEKFFKKVKMQA